MSEKTQPKEKMVRARVARGRSIIAPVVPLEKRLVGTTFDGQPVTCAVTKTYDQGEWCDLPADEVPTLRARGYLMEPEQEHQPFPDPSLAMSRVEAPRDGAPGFYGSR